MGTSDWPVAGFARRVHLHLADESPRLAGQPRDLLAIDETAYAAELFRSVVVFLILSDTPDPCSRKALARNYTSVRAIPLLK